MRIPLATYRLQLTPDFGFRRAVAVLDYLRNLGISDLYLSPIFQARQGSCHGYDIVDHTSLNAGLGTAVDFSALVRGVRERGMGWLQDIVPNHMAIDGDNRLLSEMLEEGPSSRAGRVFDVDWSRPGGSPRPRLLIPLLGEPFGAALERGSLRLEYGREGFGIRYHQLRLPLRLESYGELLDACRELLENAPRDRTRLGALAGRFRKLPAASADPGRRQGFARLKERLWRLHEQSAPLRRALEEALTAINGRPGEPESFNRLEQLLADQWFRLAFWKVAAEEINYRRFFCINDLIALRMEHAAAFDLAHRLPLRLIEEKVATGLRIDHIDGLYDPAGYLRQLRTLCPDTHLVVEKILAPEEDLPDWPVQGTTGYDFLNLTTSLFCRTDGEAAMTGLYRRLTRQSIDYQELVTEKRRLILERHMAGDVGNLVQLLRRLACRHRYGSDLTRHGLHRALSEIMIRLPVYRTFQGRGEARPEDLAILDATLNQAQAENPGQGNEFAFIGRVLRLDFDDFLDPRERRLWRHFAMRFQQYTGPLAAKGIEDTVLYIYNRLLALNEVGGAPERFGVTADAFHAFCRQRQRHWPHALSATSTHDCKRGEDVRARLAVLSELPQPWREAVNGWCRLNRPLKKTRSRRLAPDRNDEYFLYQTLVGAWPVDAQEVAEFEVRLRDYLVKAVREAKVHTAWIKPDAAYEEAFAGFAATLFDPQHPFLADFLPFQQRVAFFGMLNSLAQALIKITAPGVPDFYQGSELWDLNLVDPDNRRPVDFERRQAALQSLQEGMRTRPERLPAELLESWPDGRAKLFVIWRALAVRRRRRRLFETGDYLPLAAEGEHGDRILAFARQLGQSWAVTVVPRFAADLTEAGSPPLGAKVWGETVLQLPPADWTEALTGRRIGRLSPTPVAKVFADFPVALLLGRVRQPPKEA